jgi:hypothetical protein
MEGKSIKEKILYWGGITLISTVIIGGSYYIYQSIFGSGEKEKEENEDNNENNSINNSFQLNDSNQNIQKNNNIDLNSSNNINNIKSTIITTNENNNINININNNINSKLIKDEDILNEENEEKIENNINIFENNIILLKSFGINIDETKLLKNSNSKITEEGIIRLIMYINYLADKFFVLDNPKLDEQRRALLDKKNNNNELLVEQDYLTLCNETLMAKQNAYQIAADKILSSLKIKLSMDELEEFVKNIDPKKLEELTIKIMTELNPTLHKYDLNIMDLNKTKEAYIYYLKIFIESEKKMEEQKENINDNEEGNNIFIFQYMSLKIKMDDLLYIKYNILDEHLKLLVNKYNLFNDNEINQLQNEFDDINKKVSNFKQ